MKKFFFIWMLFFPLILFGRGKLFFTGYTGKSFHCPSTLTLQLGKYHYTVEGVHFSSRSFEFPLYYGISIGKENANARFAIEFLHDKAFVRCNRIVRVRESNNPQIPPGMRLPFETLLSHFSVSHGCNYLHLKYEHSFFTWRKSFSGYGGIACGVLIPHVESQHFQGKKSQYEMHFPAGMMDWIFQWKIAQKSALVCGWKLTTGRISHARIVNGNVSFWIWTFHGILGIEFYP